MFHLLHYYLGSAVHNSSKTHVLICILQSIHSEFLQDITLSPASSLFPTVNTYANEEILPRLHICPLPSHFPLLCSSLQATSLEDSQPAVFSSSPPLLSWTCYSSWILPLLSNSCYLGLSRTPVVKVLFQSQFSAISQTSFTPLLSDLCHSWPFPVSWNTFFPWCWDISLWFFLDPNLLQDSIPRHSLPWWPHSVS